MKGAETKLLVSIIMIVIAIAIVFLVIINVLGVDASSIFPRGVFW